MASSYSLKNLIQVLILSTAFLFVIRPAKADDLGSILSTLLNVATSEAQSSLVDQLHSQNASTRIKAAQGLAALADATTIEPLINVLNDSNSDVRLWSIIALGNIGSPRATDALIRKLRDQSFGVRLAAGTALFAITGRDFGTDADKWLSWWSANRAQILAR